MSEPSLHLDLSQDQQETIGAMVVALLILEGWFEQCAPDAEIAFEGSTINVSLLLMTLLHRWRTQELSACFNLDEEP